MRAVSQQSGQARQWRASPIHQVSPSWLAPMHWRLCGQRWRLRAVCQRSRLPCRWYAISRPQPGQGSRSATGATVAPVPMWFHSVPAGSVACRPWHARQHRPHRRRRNPRPVAACCASSPTSTPTSTQRSSRRLSASASLRARSSGERCGSTSRFPTRERIAAARCCVGHQQPFSGSLSATPRRRRYRLGRVG